MYSAKDSVYKQETRAKLYDKVVGHLGDSKDKLNFLTFPNLNISLESRLLDKYTASRVLAYEIDKEVWKKLRKICKYTRILPIYGDIFECDRVEDDQVEEKLSFIWLDFCNSYSDGFLKKLIHLVEELPFEDRAVLSITLNKRRGKRSDDLYYNNFYPNYKDEGIAYHIRDILGRENVQEIERMTYICKDIDVHCGCMNVFTFLINKNQTKCQLKEV